MATSEVDLKWIWYNVIIASDDSDNNIGDIKSWNNSGNVLLSGYFGFEMNGYYNDVVCDWGFVCDGIGIGYCKEIIMGAKAAPGGVATGIMFVCGEGGSAVVLWWCLYGFIFKIYLFVWLVLLYDIIEAGEGQETCSIKAESISARGERGEAIVGGVVLGYGGINIIFYF